MTTTTYAADRTALLIIDPYNDFMSEGGKLYEAIKWVSGFDPLALADIKRFVNASLPADDALTAEADAFAEAVARPTTPSIIERALEQGFQQRSDVELNLGAYVGKVVHKLGTVTPAGAVGLRRRKEKSMTSSPSKGTALITSVLAAHGGLENWARVRKITARLSLGGPFWGARGWPEVYAGQTVTIDPHREHIEFTPFSAPDRTSVLDVDPERVVIKAADGRVVEERTDPRASFPKRFDFKSTRWDAIQVAYFTSAAVWNYLTEPFVFTYPGVQAREIAPWQENEHTWRRLAVKFPSSIANHNAEQVFYYDKDYMLRRMDYSPDVTGNPPVAHYTRDPKTFDGFVFPTRRLVHLHNAKGIADQSFAAITINIDAVSVESTQ